ncbi:MAG: hypothetical protein AAF721_36125 [Myxococcota bacterium]
MLSVAAAIPGCKRAPTTPPSTTSAPAAEPAAPQQPPADDPSPSRALVLPLNTAVPLDAGDELVLTSFIVESIAPAPGSGEAGGETSAMLDFELRAGDDPIQIHVSYATTPDNPSGLPVTERVGDLELTVLAVDASQNPSATVVLTRAR